MRASMVLTDRDKPSYWPPCEHGDGDLRERLIAGGATQFVFQCHVCGRAGSPLPYLHDVVQRRPAKTPAFDDTIAAHYLESRRELAQQEREKGDQERQQEYDAYITSDAWHRRRTAVLMRDGRRCQARLDGCEGVAIQAHHLTYKHFGNEPLFDLIAVCPTCHDQITAMDRARRQTAA